ncbi:Cell-cell signaling protein csgA-like [Zea mays]|uniref:Cell-cell signaling protein csgA-like n=1 Tax=Zea mays TaxID=4577 RepID=A0A1D6KFZ2_MAIZE|nr:Cell-cell signaling protein csgA-like [Zea mays]
MARLAVAARAFSAAASGGGVSLVQGASRGIGLEFVRQLLRRSDGGRVVATCRTPGSAAELQKLREEHAPGRLTVLPLDVTDESTIEAAAASITETHGSLDLLINSAGILSIPNVIQPGASSFHICLHHILAQRPQFRKHGFVPSSNISETKFFLAPVPQRLR